MTKLVRVYPKHTKVSNFDGKAVIFMENFRVDLIYIIIYLLPKEQKYIGSLC